MKIGKRLRYFRRLRGLSQKTLGMMIGFPEDSAEVRITQYETGLRNPREKLFNAMCAALDISPAALIAPHLETVTELMHNGRYIWNHDQKRRLCVLSDDRTI